MKLTKTELLQRQDRFRNAMNASFPDWDTAIIVTKVNQYYFTGTMQDALLMIHKNGDTLYFVRRSFERAVIESPFHEIHPMHSYRDAAQKTGKDLGNVYIEADSMPYAVLERLKNHFHFSLAGSLETLVRTVRAVKSNYELYWLERAGMQNNRLLTEIVPELMFEGMRESDFWSKVAEQMITLGHQGLVRFWRFDTEVFIGQCCFGQNSIYPSFFEGPAGARGSCPAVPIAGDPATLLRRGDLVLVDIGFGMEGYHSDKTQVYSFGAPPSDEVLAAHQMCLNIQTDVACRLVPGALPSEIYAETIGGISEAEKENFMGYGKPAVKFLGHGVGLHVDELPVIAKGFDAPLEENMVISIEPKKAITGQGLVGVEDIYAVTPSGGRCLSGGGGGIIIV